MKMTNKDSSFVQPHGARLWAGSVQIMTICALHLTLHLFFCTSIESSQSKSSRVISTAGRVFVMPCMTIIISISPFYLLDCFLGKICYEIGSFLFELDVYAVFLGPCCRPE